MEKPKRFKRTFQNPAVNALRFGVTAFTFFCGWLYNTKLFYGHYEHSFGPFWIIVTSTVAIAIALILAVYSLFQKFSGKRLFLAFMLAFLAFPIGVFSYFQMLEILDDTTDSAARDDYWDRRSNSNDR